MEGSCQNYKEGIQNQEGDEIIRGKRKQNSQGEGREKRKQNSQGGWSICSLDAMGSKKGWQAYIDIAVLAS